MVIPHVFINFNIIIVMCVHIICIYLYILVNIILFLKTIQKDKKLCLHMYLNISKNISYNFEQYSYHVNLEAVRDGKKDISMVDFKPTCMFP